jgi:hypothetical protein
MEKIAELLKYRAKRKNRRFERLIEPMYLALKKVHQDYLFETAEKDLASDRSLSAVADSLELRRREEEAERRAILQQAVTLRTNKSLMDCHSFFDATVDYFHETPFSGGSTPSNMLLNALHRAAAPGA